MNGAKAHGLNFHVVQPFILDRYVKALDPNSMDTINEIWKREKLSLVTLRDVLAAREESLHQQWQTRHASEGTRAGPNSYQSLVSNSNKVTPQVNPFASRRVSGRGQSIQLQVGQNQDNKPFNETEGIQETVDTENKGDPTNGAERLRYCLHPKCKSVRHRLFSCQRYISLALCDREELLAKNGICRSCVQAFHPSEICTDICDHCDVKHNSTLCYSSEAKRARFNHPAGQINR